MGRMKTADKKKHSSQGRSSADLRTFKRACDGRIIRGKWQNQRQQIY